MVDPRADSLELVPSRYEAWRDRFDAERDRVLDALAATDLEARLDRIEHVGSTAVPGLPAKDVVDLDVVVADGAVEQVSRALERDLGGDRFENTDRWQPIFRVHDGQRFNDHVFAASDDGWKVSVVTREVLRRRPDLRAEYERLKRELVAEHDDLEAYSEGKTEFIRRVLAVAESEYASAFDFPVPSSD